MYPSYKKPGYSVIDTAKVLHVTPRTVRIWIDSGKLGALMSDDKVVKGKKRQIRVLPEHIREFMRHNKGRFEESQLKTWGVLDDQEHDETIDEKLSRDISGEELANDPELFQALCDKLSGVESTVEPTTDKVVTPPPAKTASAKIIVDGRIALGNISRESAVAIVDVLMKDPLISFGQVTIDVN